MKNLLIAGGILILVTTAASYFLVARYQPKDLTAQKNNLEINLAKAKSKLKKQNDTLQSMIGGLDSAYPFGSAVQEHMKKATDLVHQTDFAFSDANGTNPNLIFTGISDDAINAEREDINLLLELWAKKMKLSGISAINLDSSAEILDQTELVAQFIHNLTTIVSSLTPENSGLSQSQIDTYIAQLPQVGSIDSIVSSLTSLIQNAPGSPSSNFPQNNNSNKDTIPLVSSFGAPPTQTEIQAQENAVTQAQVEVNDLQNQLNQINQELSQAPTPAPTPEPAPESDTPPFVSRKIDTKQGIIIQLGPVRIISSTDPF